MSAPPLAPLPAAATPSRPGSPPPSRPDSPPPHPVPVERIGDDTRQWPVWSTTARLVTTDPAALDEAYSLVVAELAAVGSAASRFREDSEISAVHRAAGRPVEISPLLAELLRAALHVARETGGDVDPTVGSALTRLGYDRDLDDLDRAVAGLPTAGFSQVSVSTAASWRHLQLSGRMLTVPTGVIVDLGATAKAWTADRCARLVADRLGTGVLVSLGGDIATAGPGPSGGWQIHVQDRPGDPATSVTLPPGAAIATSSTVSRQWRHGDRAMHHIINPRTCAPVEPVWRSATVAAYRCVDANAQSTAALVRGRDALAGLDRIGAPARLVAADRTVHTTRAWPEEVHR
jgi:FAD:protein FMN transferase